LETKTAGGGWVCGVGRLTCGPKHEAEHLFHVEEKKLQKKGGDKAVKSGGSALFLNQQIVLRNDQGYGGQLVFSGGGEGAG